MSDPAKPGMTSATTDEAELDRLANEVNMDGLDDDDDDDTEEFASLASELMQESASAAPSNGVPANGSTARPSIPMRSSTSAPAVSALGSFMNRARTSGFAGLRFGQGGVTGTGSLTGGPGARDAFDVLGVREGARWRLILAQDATRPAPTRPLSRSYRCDRGRVRPLDEQLASSLGVEAMRSSCASAKIVGEELNELLKLAEKMGNVLLPDIERAIGSRLALDPDFDKARFPKAAARFGT